MQLPRGRFHRLLKSTTSHNLMEEMASARFTGICTIILGRESAVLVLNEGLVVLAEYGGIKGQHALDAVLKSEESEAAAELNLLTPEQLRLAREFNEPFAIADKVKRPSPAKNTDGRANPTAGSMGSTPAQKHRREPAGEQQKNSVPGRKPEDWGVTASPSGDDDIEMLIQNMEEMDMEQFISSFRVSCKDMLRRIHLDHLIQEKDT